MSIVVFLGPSLLVDDARAVLPEATYLPPAAAGDVYRAVQQGAKVIAIIDGFFEQVPSVWHKEVLYALARGVHVYGASSMGALRAAELHTFGMIGVGKIFEAYRDGICEDDDEVTVIHGPAERGYKPLSEAMMNVRYGLAQALARNVIGQGTHDVVLAALKRCHYPERTWALLPEIATEHALPSEEMAGLLAFVRKENTNLKRLDALACLTELVPHAAALPAPFEASFDFESTVFWTQLAGAVRSAPSASTADVPIEAIRGHLAIVEPEAASIFNGALLLYLVAKEAHRLDIQADPQETERAAAHFRRQRGLLTAQATHAWLDDNHTGQKEFTALMEMVVLVQALLARHSNGVDAFLPAELMRRGKFESVSTAVAEKRGVLDSLGLKFPSPEDAGTTAAELVAWYEQRFRPLDAPFDEHRKDRGVSDRGRFLREVLAEFIRDRHAGVQRAGSLGAADA